MLNMYFGFPSVCVWRIRLAPCGLYHIYHKTSTRYYFVLFCCDYGIRGRIILCMRIANDRRCYHVTSSIIGWAHVDIDPCTRWLDSCDTLIILTHPPKWRIYASVNWVSVASGNGMSPVWRHAITWTSAGLLSIGLMGRNFSEIRIKIQNFPVAKMHFKMSCAKMAAILPREV